MFHKVYCARAHAAKAAESGDVKKERESGQADMKEMFC